MADEFSPLTGIEIDWEIVPLDQLSVRDTLKSIQEKTEQALLRQPRSRAQARGVGR
ncbi:hypothetical protein D3C83_322130 [compost metagenome]